jgi:hypothetical protein
MPVIHEIDHALGLLQAVSETGTWEGGASIMEADPTCGFRPSGQSRCGAPIGCVITLLHKDRSQPCWTLVLCVDHGEVMRDAIAQWRKVT